MLKPDRIDDLNSRRGHSFFLEHLARVLGRSERIPPGRLVQMLERQVLELQIGGRAFEAARWTQLLALAKTNPEEAVHFAENLELKL